MSTETTNLKLVKPDLTDTADITVINANMDAIDSAVSSKAPLSSPVLTGTPQAPTPASNDNSTNISTTAFVKAAIAALIGSTPTLLSTLQQIDAAINNDPNLYNDIMTAINNSLASSETYTNGITGTLSSLSTTAKNNLVAAINEVLYDSNTVNNSLNTHIGDASKHIDYVVSTNSSNAYSVTASGITSYYDGLPLCVKFNAASTGNATLNVNNLGAKNIYDCFGSPVASIKANVPYNLRYESVSGNFILLGKGGEGNAGAPQILTGYNSTTTAGLVAGTMPENGALNYTPSGSAQTIPAGHTTGGTVAAVSVPVANVLTGTTIAGQAGTMPENGALGATLTTQGQTYTIPAGHTSGGTVTANIANLTAANIIKNVAVGGITGTGSTLQTGTVTATSGGQLAVSGLPINPRIVVLIQSSFPGSPSSPNFSIVFLTKDGFTLFNGTAYTRYALICSANLVHYRQIGQTKQEHQ